MSTRRDDDGDGVTEVAEGLEKKVYVSEKPKLDGSTFIEKVVVKEPFGDASAKKQKSKGKGKGKGKSIPSPEEIARIRAERAAAREEKQKKMLANGLDPDCPPELQFIRRPLLTLHDDEPEKSFTFTLMTYNCLAQALIRRKLFPDSGEAVKWYRRSRVLLNEFKYYNPDLICLQEIDHIQFQSFWQEEFKKMGYASQFHRIHSKNHGVAIVWKNNLFRLTDRMLIDFDKELSGDILPRTKTNNTGLILSLKYSDSVLAKYPELGNNNKSGIIIGTTHLFWHPFGTYERTRQCFVLLNKVKEFKKRVNVLQNNNDGNMDHWTAFFCGDFNSQPFDTPYLSITSKPVEYKERAKIVIECSTSYTYSKLRNGDDDEAEDEEGGNIEKFGKDQPQTPVPDSYTPTPEQADLVSKMESLHNSLNMKATSLYAVGYKKVHPENSGLDNKKGEPEISNWAHSWRGLLDYIFYVDHWDFSDCKEVEDFEKFEKKNHMKLRGYLRMPPATEMSKYGQPHQGEYPSDHLSMMCKIELNP
ncbi:hypothetical protein TPHA_0I00320 [Tetrapisispora phaffii CBS 4417]|uniref:Endonuclease/exonuclease/phosphatase domain-containing protein n=1 Tax=Tetrapisispora phaffii (strain ATCC 24235 / CBS 4417 / NBRC 1672 / NRRL Y-8282 / UCD 70-5) TaxID=1071381 RepID=G8BXB1_TETPH|nr:hypothetical protein TPHA_0I00320 [Tetrapisispora phaffii CBS 4417]CCE64539.1 hypothetical protein TPHA_0I00320 [Tetrapisispora phaffii CBS 4417]